jgi:SPP1 gp7 family putative phage head morphogenesis protein
VDVDDLYDAEEEQRLLGVILFPVYEWELETNHELIAGALAHLGLEDFRLDDEATRRQLALAAEQVVGISATDREGLGDVLREGQRRGYSDHQIAEGVPAEGYAGIRGLYGVTWRSRPEVIARTELATAQLAAAKDRYKASGVVSRVQIVENEDTDEPCASMNGKVFPVDEAPGLEHPQCRRGYIPLVDEGA